MALIHDENRARGASAPQIQSFRGDVVAVGCGWYCHALLTGVVVVRVLSACSAAPDHRLNMSFSFGDSSEKDLQQTGALPGQTRA